MQLQTRNSNSLIEELQTEKKQSEETKQILKMKVQDFHQKMQKERNEKLFQKNRQIVMLPPILQDDQNYPYQFNEDDFEDEETYHINNFDEIEKELETFYLHKI
ncbi:unnamed protein product (macronuclear) [Paramecium tetraurelia]|uniref:Uncharacterized protein n=1 Tax=Paramecium tetraurelia TaxID=5888 RepID=A0BWI2_PARTE|nr:uncharacterized protein GSPATT00032751001 [Paramecium tetraurelia]CAK62899.1 unnamed protein product [Paramecium tetraurelia]|eukprot:XP_001430297.1 hypothetical protein (macronuclear) [Paramecium tetraurelia strain d4-2]